MAKKIDYASLFTLRKDGRYMYRWTDDQGKRHAIYDRDPEALYAKVQALGDPAPVVTFREVAEAWEAEYRETISVRSWLNLKPHYEDIKAAHGATPISEMTGAAVNADLLAAKAKDFSRTVVNNRRVIYNGIFNYAVAKGLILYNPVLSIKLPKGLKHGKRTAPTDAQIRTICSGTDAPFGLFPFLCLCTGLRKGEALALGREDVDLKAKPTPVIHVTKSLVYLDNANPSVKSPKTEAGTRDVPIIKELLPHLEKLCKESDGPLFPAQRSNRAGKGGGYMTERGYEGAWQRYCESVGLVDGEGKPTLTAHQLRHGTATLLFESGVDVYTAQRILGHANVRTTMEIYTELREKQQRKSVSKFNRSVSKLVSETSK